MTEYYFVKNKNSLFHSLRIVHEEFDTTHGSVVWSLLRPRWANCRFFDVTSQARGIMLTAAKQPTDNVNYLGPLHFVKILSGQPQLPTKQLSISAVGCV